MYRSLLSFLALALGLTAFAQKGSITGTITAYEAGQVQPMPFVNVAIKGTTIGGTTDLDGKFSFPAELGTYTLAVSFVGYESQEV
ncbi:MAG TPA: carboxypeptidase-like regulatory domain-containing protein, partial [Flavobacteriales bacterium]|nr:carboxypeptidase-like regulatory domain-containing protein [Flavobacteriales bacterium]